MPIQTPDDETKETRDPNNPILPEDLVTPMGLPIAALQELHRLELRNRALINSIPDLMLVLGRDGIFRDFNSSALTRPLVPPDEIIGSNVDSVLPPELSQLAMSLLNDALKNNNVATAEYTIKREGYSGHFEARVTPSGPDEALFIIRNITERKNAERDLLASQQMLRHLVDQSPLAVILWNNEFQALEWNPAAEEIFGYTKEEMSVTRGTLNIVPLRMRPSIEFVFQSLLDQHGGLRSTNENTTKDGQTIYCEWYNSPLLDEDGDTVGVISLVQDVSERVRVEKEHLMMEKQLLETQKLESLGLLAGGIAHDFNNILVGIMGNASLALSEIDPKSDLFCSLQAIERAAMHAADLTRQMLAYSGKGQFVVERINLSRIVEEMLELLKLSISKSAQLDINLVPDLPDFQGDATQIRQVAMNLMINASDALQEKPGTISITTRLTDSNEPFTGRSHPAPATGPGPWLCLEVADTGKGMGPDVCERIFDPFFSTKQTGRGLGLAAVLGIVRSHHGIVRFFSKPNLGTRFQVLFPVTKDEAKPHLNHESNPRAAPPGTNILIIDDDATCLNVTSRILNKAGYTTTCAPGGLEAVVMFSEKPTTFNLVILDLTMPHLNGEQTFVRLRELNPTVSVLITSGYDEQESIQRFSQSDIAGFIHKPFRANDLLRMVQKALARANT
ncbi:hypothetical protein CVU37_13085 [candidate division BRC1 bacterium HGW-BRC1-1]|jgi:PAS domain S-box-containing protein|nr:MAG: hypothetical protein CVU37_13085 [candidate division BRC1 bacterium HGW-BRC1-1]